MRVWEPRAQGHGTRGRIDHRLGELQRAGISIGAAILKRQPDADRPARRAACLLAQREQVSARLLDIDEHRVEPLDGRQRIGLAGGDEPAGRHQRAADASADRGGDAGVAKVDAGDFERCPVLRNARRRLARGGGGVGIVLPGDRFHLRERTVARGLGGGSGAGRLGAGKIGLRLCGIRLIEAGIDLIERLAGADERSFGKGARADHARHLRPHFGAFERGGAAGERGGQLDRLHLHNDIAGLRCRFFSVFAVRRRAARKRQHHGERDSGKAEAGVGGKPVGKLQASVHFKMRDSVVAARAPAFDPRHRSIWRQRDALSAPTVGQQSRFTDIVKV